LQYFFKFLFTCLASFFLLHVQAQFDSTINNRNNDTIKFINIINAENLRQITLNDSTILETLSGNAIVKQGTTILSGDSIVLNKRTGITEVFGNVHINNADTVNTYSQYLMYVGNDQIAYLKNKVKFSDGKATLFTENLEYNLKTGIANYKNGGKVINEKTVLTSENAVYYSDTKDVFFQKNVHLVDPKYDMIADSLRYNTAFKNTYFIAPTFIKSKNGNIETHSGTYNLQTGEAIFFDKTIFRDGDKYISGNKIAFDEKSDIVQIEENGKFVDSSKSIIVLGNQILIDKKNNTFLATRKPVMIFYKNKDSTYISADTLFSGKKPITLVEKSDSLQKNLNTSIKKENQDSISYFIGFHHVRIFNDSIQAASDSLYYSTEDSTFKLFQQPICWNVSTQITGDTMFLCTENKQPKEVKVFYNTLVINKTPEGFYNQISGKTINGYFKEGEIYYIKTKGNPAESIFYPQDEENAYIGMNKSTSDVIELFIVNKNANKIKYINDVKGILYPMNQIPEQLKLLKNFNWQDTRRPKNKLELFE